MIALDTDGINTGVGNNTFQINDSVVRCEDDCIDLSSGNDNISLLRSRVESLDNEAIRTSNGDDVILAVDSDILGGPQCCNNFGIDMSDGNDQVTIINTRVAGFSDSIATAINTGSEDDIITLGTGARIDGLIRCGNGFDTLIFTMDVPEDVLVFLSSEIASANPAGDSITINGLFYEWEDCELLVSELVGVPVVPRPIPTLSEWGLIAMAGILGIVGLMVIRKRKVAV